MDLRPPSAKSNEAILLFGNMSSSASSLGGGLGSLLGGTLGSVIGLRPVFWHCWSNIPSCRPISGKINKGPDSLDTVHSKMIVNHLNYP